MVLPSGVRMNPDLAVRSKVDVPPAPARQSTPSAAAAASAACGTAPIRVRPAPTATATAATRLDRSKRLIDMADLLAGVGQELGTSRLWAPSGEPLYTRTSVIWPPLPAAPLLLRIEKLRSYSR